LALASALGVVSTPRTPVADAGEKGVVPVKATGSFEVKLVPQADDAGTGLGRFLLDKVYRGDLEATARGEMLSAGNARTSGAYVAVETVSGKLLGREGTFALVHRGVMAGGRADLSITVVPDSGTGELRGLEATLSIEIDPGGVHFYTLEGTLNASPSP